MDKTIQKAFLHEVLAALAARLDSPAGKLALHVLEQGVDEVIDTGVLDGALDKLKDKLSQKGG